MTKAPDYQIDHDLTEPLVYEDYSYELRLNKSLIYTSDCEFSLVSDDQLLAELDKARAKLGYSPLADYLSDEDYDAAGFDAMLLWDRDTDDLSIVCLVTGSAEGLPDDGKEYTLLLTDHDKAELVAELKADYAKA